MLWTLPFLTLVVEQVPNLFAKDEVMTIIEAMTPKAKRAGRGISPPEVYAYFVEQCRANLHMVLAMSPVGDAFRLVLNPFATALLAPCRSLTFVTTDACPWCIPDDYVCSVSWLVRPACSYHLPAKSPSLFTFKTSFGHGKLAIFYTSLCPGSQLANEPHLSALCSCWSPTL